MDSKSIFNFFSLKGLKKKKKPNIEEMTIFKTDKNAIFGHFAMVKITHFGTEHQCVKRRRVICKKRLEKTFYI